MVSDGLCIVCSLCLATGRSQPITTAKTHFSVLLTSQNFSHVIRSRYWKSGLVTSRTRIAVLTLRALDKSMLTHIPFTLSGYTKIFLPHVRILRIKQQQEHEYVRNVPLGQPSGSPCPVFALQQWYQKLLLRKDCEWPWSALVPQYSQLSHQPCYRAHPCLCPLAFVYGSVVYEPVQHFCTCGHPSITEKYFIYLFLTDLLRDLMSLLS